MTFKKIIKLEEGMKIFNNRKATHNFYFFQELEAGIILKGTEIKSIRVGKLNFKDSFARIENNEVWLYNLHISVYEKGNINNHDPERRRKLLLNKREIKKLKYQVEERGMTLIPKNFYINELGLAKITLALARGKKLYDKRETLRKKDEMIEIKRRKGNL